MICWHSSAVTPSGFSQRTCLPAWPRAPRTPSLAVGSGDIYRLTSGSRKHRPMRRRSMRAGAELRGEEFRFFAPPLTSAATLEQKLRVAKARQDGPLRDVPQADHRVAHLFGFRHQRSPSIPFAADVRRAPHSVLGRTDCGQTPKGCKAPRMFCNTTTRDCIFSLDTTRAAAQNPRNFFRGLSGSRGTGAAGRERFAANGDPSTRTANGKLACVIPEGKKRAVFAGMDCAVHQSGVRGSRPLAAGYRLRRRTLQQLQRSAPQCSATAGPTLADASPLAGKLPSTGPLAFATALVAASDSQGRSSRPPRRTGRAVPAGFSS